MNRNYYLTHLKSFTRWMVRDRRMKTNPFEHLQGGNTRTDRRHDRRELTADELRLILDTARQSEAIVRGIDGPTRAVLYSLAAGTGFRASELASLTPESFDLDAEPPTATIAAGYAKNRRTAEQPIALEVAELLRDFLASKPAGKPIFPGGWAHKRRAAELLKADLAAAGIPYAVEGPDGLLFADFHALRHSFISLLTRGGVSLRTVQQMARHSSPLLTARYAHVQLNDMADAAEKLPKLLPTGEQLEAAVMMATGTDGKNASTSAYPACTIHVPERRIPSHSDALPCTMAASGERGESKGNARRKCCALHG